MPFPNRLHGLFSTSLATILLMTILSWIPTSTIISGQDSGLDRKADFGFSGMDVFRLGAAGGPWHASDLDNDGDLDLTIWIDDRGELVHFLRDPESEGFVHMEAGNTLVDPAGWRRMETSVGASVEAGARAHSDDGRFGTGESGRLRAGRGTFRRSERGRRFRARAGRRGLWLRRSDR